MPGAGAPLVKSFVSGGCDNMLKVWRFDEARGVWAVEQVRQGYGGLPQDCVLLCLASLHCCSILHGLQALGGHSDWVRDVAWAPNLGMPANTIASAGQDGKVLIWTQSEPGGTWTPKLLTDFKTVVWRVSWSVFGNVLAVSDASGAVSLWKEALDGDWTQIQRVAE